MKKKIAVGQCYEIDDKIYEVVRKWKSKTKNDKCCKFWWVREVITKEEGTVSEASLLSWRRPFNTEG